MPTVMLFGGTSSERRVSVASARNLAAVIEDPVLWFLAPDGSVHVCGPGELLAHTRPFEEDFAAAAPPRWTTLARALDSCPGDAVVLIALHGGEGEDGTIQRLLEARRIAFTGSGSEASALAFDKARARDVAARSGVAVADAVRLGGSAEAVRAALAAFFARSGRMVVKPVADGSSINLHHVRGAEEIPRVAAAVAACGVPFLAERFVSGVELTVGVVEEGGRAIALPPSEVRLDAGHTFDFEGKYLGRGTKEITPAEVEPAVATRAQDVAVTMHRATGARGYSRTDVIAGAEVVFLEINTLPGLTAASFVPQQLAASGRTISAFVASQLALARAR
jgi:D-alanine-D-alanine ligase